MSSTRQGNSRPHDSGEPSGDGDGRPPGGGKAGSGAPGVAGGCREQPGSGAPEDGVDGSSLAARLRGARVRLAVLGLVALSGLAAAMLGVGGSGRGTQPDAAPAPPRMLLAAAAGASGDEFESAAPPGGAAVLAGGPVYYPYGPEDYGGGACGPAEVGERVLTFDLPPQLCIDPAGAYLARFDTSHGSVLVLLDSANTPGTVNNFVNLARFGYYDRTLIHRSDPAIGILQGGSPHTGSADDPGPGYGIWDEGAGFGYPPGRLAMARTDEPDSADAQFFFTVTDAARVLDGQGDYVVFGEVIEGLDVLASILDSHVADPSSTLGGAPDPPAVVNSVTIESG